MYGVSPVSKANFKTGKPATRITMLKILTMSLINSFFILLLFYLKITHKKGGTTPHQGVKFPQWVRFTIFYSLFAALNMNSCASSKRIRHTRLLIRYHKHLVITFRFILIIVEKSLMRTNLRGRYVLINCIRVE